VPNEPGFSTIFEPETYPKNVPAVLGLILNLSLLLIINSYGWVRGIEPPIPRVTLNLSPAVVAAVTFTKSYQQYFSVYPSGATSTMSAVAIGDINGDHHTDILVGTDQFAMIEALYGDGKGGFIPQSYGVPQSTWDVKSLRLAELDGTGYLGFIGTEYSPNFGLSSGLATAWHSWNSQFPFLESVPQVNFLIIVEL
jgi:hypothetical protein